MSDLMWAILCGIKRAIWRSDQHLDRCPNWRGWISVVAADDNMAHVYPVRDSIVHEAWEECPCGPAISAEFRGDGSNGWLAVHHSLDGRELRE